MQEIFNYEKYMNRNVLENIGIENKKYLVILVQNNVMNSTQMKEYLSMVRLYRYCIYDDNHLLSELIHHSFYSFKK